MVTTARSWKETTAWRQPKRDGGPEPDPDPERERESGVTGVATNRPRLAKPAIRTWAWITGALAFFTPWTASGSSTSSGSSGSSGGAVGAAPPPLLRRPPRAALEADLRTISHSFRAMGTTVTLIGPEDADPIAFRRAARGIEWTFAREEVRFSRFRPESELSRVNASAGRWVLVSPRFAAVTRFALEAAARTGGLFDPTILPTLIAAGYDPDLDEVLAGARGRLHTPEPCGRFAEVRLERDWLRMPTDVALDFGAVAKGWTVDLAAGEAVAASLPWAIVNAGGDLRIAGVPPDEGVDVGVEDPAARENETLSIRLLCGALATSSVSVRRWGPGLHHVMDPRSGTPADGEVVQATVWAETCAAAEILSTWALLEGPAYLQRGPAVLLLADGRTLMNLDEGEPVELGS